MELRRPDRVVEKQEAVDAVYNQYEEHLEMTIVKNTPLDKCAVTVDINKSLQVI